MSKQDKTAHSSHSAISDLTFRATAQTLGRRTKYHYDYRGSTIALTDDTGAVTDRIEYSLYGLQTYRFGISDTPFLFNGRYGVMSDSNGLLYMQARYYNPYLCRFISADPSGLSAGLNLYAYGNGNPVSFIDPFGMGALGDVSGGSWFHEAFQGTPLGDWGRGFSYGLEAWGNGEDLSKYALSGSGAYLGGIQSGYNAVSSAIEIGALLLTLPTAGASIEAEAGIDLVAGVGRSAVGSAGRSGLARTAAEGIPQVTAKGLARVEAHLDDVLANQFSDFSRADQLTFQAGERGMLDRLRSGATSSQDIEFYMHELKESARFRATGNLMDSHNAALQWRNVTSQDLFHPDVIGANPSVFPPSWQHP